MSKQKIFAFLAILGLIAFLIFLIIAFSPEEVRSMPQKIIGVTCFFIFLMVGIPFYVLANDPDAISWPKKHIETTNNSNIN